MLTGIICSTTLHNRNPRAQHHYMLGQNIVWEHSYATHYSGEIDAHIYGIDEVVKLVKELNEKTRK